MDSKDIKPILQDALERDVPAAQIDLLPRIKERLVAGTIQQGDRMNTIKSRRFSRAALAVLTAGILMALAFATPQGRALAQQVIQFFTRAEGYQRPLPPGQIPPQEEAQPRATAMPPAPLVSVAEAERAAGFDAKELPADPEGFTFLGAMAGGGSISIEYQADGGGGALVINESHNGFMQSEWDQAPAEAVSQVKVGELDAEIVHGTYVVYAGETVAKWNPDAPILRLRWIEDGIWFEMARFGEVEAIAYLDQASMIALAESLVYAP